MVKNAEFIWLRLKQNKRSKKSYKSKDIYFLLILIYTEIHITQKCFKNKIINTQIKILYNIKNFF